MNQHTPLSNIINKLQRKELLLKLEYDYEKETFRQQTEAMGIGRKVKRGMCWYPSEPLQGSGRGGQIKIQIP